MYRSVSKEDNTTKYMTVTDLVRGEWRFSVQLDVKFCGASLVHRALIEKGKMLKIEVDKEEEEEWREALVWALGLNEEAVVPEEQKE